MSRLSIRSRVAWDWLFLGLLPLLGTAAAIGMWFGGPLDNLIVVAWLLPVWIFGRTAVVARQ